MVDVNTQINSTHIDELEGQFRGSLVLPGDEEYDDARAVWNGMIDKHPAIVAQCHGVADVRSAVTFARENDLLVAVRGGGHSAAGSGVCDDGLVIDLSTMNGIWVDPEAETATVQAGATWADVDHETQEFGLATVGGVVSTTGVAGLSLGGGIGYLTRKHGLTCDNIASFDVVTADGSYLTASQEQNRDLYWALRGGGGNFGVVTSFEYELHELGPEIAKLFVAYPYEDAATVIREHRELMDGAPDELASLVDIWTIPEEPPFFPEEVQGEAIAAIGGIYAGPVDEGEEVIQPFREIVEPVFDWSGVEPYADYQASYDPFLPEGTRAYWKSLTLDSLDEDAIDTILTYANERERPPSAMVIVRKQGGEMARIDPDETAYADRESPWLFQIDCNWSDPDDDDENVAWTRDFWEAMQPYSTNRMYFNFGTFDEEEDIVRATYGENYERLVEVKNEYDPENLFRLNQNIEPTV